MNCTPSFLRKALAVSSQGFVVFSGCKETFSSLHSEESCTSQFIVGTVEILLLVFF